MIVDIGEAVAYLQVAKGFTLPDSAITFVNLVAPMIEGAIKKKCGCNFEQATYIEFLPEENRNLWGDSGALGYELIGGMAMPRVRGDLSNSLLRLRETPVRSITSIYENLAAWNTAGGDWPASTLLAANSYYLDAPNDGISFTGFVRRNLGAWGGQSRTVKVTYVAGYTAEEINSEFPALKLAILQTIQFNLFRATAFSKATQAGGPLASVGIEDFSVSYQAMNAFSQSGVTIPAEAVKAIEPYINYTRFV